MNAVNTSLSLDAKADTNLKNLSFKYAQKRIILVTMFCYLFYYTGRQTFGFAILGMEQELGITKDTLGWISAAMLWSYAIGQAINGNISDKYGGRVLVSFGAVSSSFLNWIISFAASVYSILVPWILNGFVQAMGWAPGAKVLSNWFNKKERGRVYGLYSFSSGMSSVVAFALASCILQFNLNWRWIFRLPLLALLFAGIVYYIFIRNKPEDLGFKNIEEDDESVKHNNIKNNKINMSVFEQYKYVLSNFKFIITSISFAFLTVARYGLLIWVPVHFLGTNWKTGSDFGQWYALSLPIGMSLGALASGWLTDNIFKSKRSPVISLFMGLAAIMSIAMYFIPQNNFLGLIALFFCGFFVFGSGPVSWALIPDLLGKQLTGTASGVMNTMAYILAGLAEPLIGKLIMINNDNTLLIFPVVAIVCILSSIIGIFIAK